MSGLSECEVPGCTMTDEALLAEGVGLCSACLTRTAADEVATSIGAVDETRACTCANLRMLNFKGEMMDKIVSMLGLRKTLYRKNIKVCFKHAELVTEARESLLMEKDPVSFIFGDAPPAQSQASPRKKTAAQSKAQDKAATGSRFQISVNGQETTYLLIEGPEAKVPRYDVDFVTEEEPVPSEVLNESAVNVEEDDCQVIDDEDDDDDDDDEDDYDDDDEDDELEDEEDEDILDMSDETDVDCSEAIDYLMSQGVLQSKKKCSKCSKDMKLKVCLNSVDRKTWNCGTHGDVSLREDSIFSSSKLPLSKLVKLINCFCNSFTEEKASITAKITPDRVADWFTFLSEILEVMTESKKEKIGGKGKSVELYTCKGDAKSKERTFFKGHTTRGVSSLGGIESDNSSRLFVSHWSEKPASLKTILGSHVTKGATVVPDSSIAAFSAKELEALSKDFVIKKPTAASAEGSPKKRGSARGAKTKESPPEPVSKPLEGPLCIELWKMRCKRLRKDPMEHFFAELKIHHTFVKSMTKKHPS